MTLKFSACPDNQTKLVHVPHYPWSSIIPNLELYHHHLKIESRKNFSDFEKQAMATSLTVQIHTHYNNNNLIWQSVSCQVDELLSQDHKRRNASNLIRWCELIHKTWYKMTDQVTTIIVCLLYTFFCLINVAVFCLIMQKTCQHLTLCFILWRL